MRHSRAGRDVAKVSIVALPPAAVCAWMIVTTTNENAANAANEHWIALGVAFAISVAIAWSVRNARDTSLRTIASVLAAYREGDFPVRARTSRADEVLADVLEELNRLGDVLRGHRLGEMEAWGLLRKVMAEVDVVVLAIDEEGRIRLANDAAARVLGSASVNLVGKRAADLGIIDVLEGTVPRIVASTAASSPMVGGPWELRRGSFRLSGEQQTLVVLSDVSRALRDNERDAWRRLIRVMGHEINNSLTPIRSISESLVSMIGKAGKGASTSTSTSTNTSTNTNTEDWETDLRDGLGVIARRAESLGRFMNSYAALAKLPPPRFAPVDVNALVTKIALLETRVPVEIIKGPSITIRADADQLEQALINLVKNSAEACSSSSPTSESTQDPGVRVGWSLENDGATILVTVEDDGPGVSETANLFVPFFTTKPNGSGIGLALSRQIVEAHDGQLSLVSRPDGRGAIARIRLPLSS